MHQRRQQRTSPQKHKTGPTTCRKMWIRQLPAGKDLRIATVVLYSVYVATELHSATKAHRSVFKSSITIPWKSDVQSEG